MKTSLKCSPLLHPPNQLRFSDIFPHQASCNACALLGFTIRVPGLANSQGSCNQWVNGFNGSNWLQYGRIVGTWNTGRIGTPSRLAGDDAIPAKLGRTRPRGTDSLGPVIPSR